MVSSLQTRIAMSLKVPSKKSQGAASPFDDLSNSWLGAVGIALAIGIAYFMAARFGLAFRAKPGGVAVFWPAAGIAIGALIALGPNARLPVAIGVIVATITSKLLITGNLWLGITFGVVCAGQTLLTAWLIERWFGRAFKLEDVPQVLGFLVASAAGAAIAGFGAVAAISFVHSTASPLDVWRPWFAACLLGTVAVAPLLIGLGEALRKLPPRRELIEGVVGLVTLAGLSVFLISLPKGHWSSDLPVALVFPLLLWVAVRCRPVFAAAAAFVVALAIIWSATFDMGHFGDASISLADRILSAQTLVLVATLLALVLAALFAERRQSEGALKQSKDRLQLALDGAELGAFSADFATGRFECDARATRFHGHNVPPLTIKEARRFVRPDDLVRIDAAVAEAARTGKGLNVQYRVVPPPNHPHTGETHWVAAESTILRNSQGNPMGLLGVTRDITHHKQAEQALAERNAQLALAGRAALVGSYVYDVNKGTMQVSEGYATIHGLPEGTTETTIGEWQARVHSEDLARAEGLREQAFADRQNEDNAEYRIVLSNGEVRWIERRGTISYGEDGRPERVIGLNIDVTERKRAEQHQRALNAELDHRVKNVLATVSAIIAQTQEASSSRTDFVAGLNRRIDSLARTHELLSESNWRGASLAQIIRREFAPYTRGNTEARGPSITLKAEATQAVATVLHELTTNAAKYGALSNGSGRVSVRWRWLKNGSHDRLVIEWQEIGGPPVLAPSRFGYGTSIIRELIPFEFGGTVELSFASGGTRCRLEIPDEWTNRNFPSQRQRSSPAETEGHNRGNP
jgi:PAS domain S-box-containing protein